MLLQELLTSTHLKEVIKNKITLSGEDIKEGLTAVLSIKMPDPKFSSQTKDKLVSSEIRNIVEHIIGEKVSTWFDQNPSIAKVVLKKLLRQLWQGM